MLRAPVLSLGSLEVVEGAPELLLFFEQFREADAQVGGLGLDLGEAQG